VNERFGQFSSESRMGSGPWELSKNCDPVGSDPVGSKRDLQTRGVKRAGSKRAGSTRGVQRAGSGLYFKLKEFQRPGSVLHGSASSPQAVRPPATCLFAPSKPVENYLQVIENKGG